VKVAGKLFTTSAGMSYPAGSFVVSMAQPKMGLIRYCWTNLLSGQRMDPRSRRRADSPVRHGDGHHVRIHGGARGSAG